ncbi:MAG: hypothetical protein ACTH1D_08635, partial [Mycobacteriaceae bacterium]
MLKKPKLTRPIRRPRLPVGWPEIAVGLTGFFAIGYALDALLSLVDPDEVTTGVVKSQIAGLAGIGGFAMACAIKTRRVKPFGLRRTTPRWILLGALGGAAWFVLRGFATP